MILVVSRDLLEDDRRSLCELYERVLVFAFVGQILTVFAGFLSCTEPVLQTY